MFISVLIEIRVDLLNGVKTEPLFFVFYMLLTTCL